MFEQDFNGVDDVSFIFRHYKLTAIQPSLMKKMEKEKVHIWISREVQAIIRMSGRRSPKFLEAQTSSSMSGRSTVTMNNPEVCHRVRRDQALE